MTEAQSCETCRHFNRQHPDYEYGFCQAPIPFWVFVEMFHLPTNHVRMDDGAKCPAYQLKPEDAVK